MQDSHHPVAANTLYLLTAAYFAWLLFVLLIFGFTPTNDGAGYAELARRCLSEGQPYPTITTYAREPFIWNIGIINLLGLSLWLTGSQWPVLLLLCAMKAAIALLLSLIARQLFGSRAAVIALLLFALYPNNWGQSTMLSSEIPSTFLCIAAAYVFIKAFYNDTHNYRPYLLAGLLLALANWFRPTATIFISAFLIFLLLKARHAFFSRTVALATGHLLFVAVVGFSCCLRTGHFVFQPRSYWFSMVDECYDGAAVAPHWGQPVWPEGTPRYIEDHERMDCFELERIWKERSIDWLKDHKMEYLSKLPGRLYYMYQSDYDNLPAFLTDKEHPERNFVTLPYRHLLSEFSTLSCVQLLAVLCQLYYAVVLLLAVLGGAHLLRRRRYLDAFMPLFVIVGGTLALILVMHGETRFKDPLMPWMFMLAGVGGWYLGGTRVRRLFGGTGVRRFFGGTGVRRYGGTRIVLLGMVCMLQAPLHAISLKEVRQLGLPVLVIETINREEPACDYVFAPEGEFGISITNVTKVPGRAVIIQQGDTVFDSGQYQKDTGGMTLSIRGNTSAYYSEKKPFKLKLEKKNDLLHRADSSFYDKNWALISDGNDVLNAMIGNKLNQLVGMPYTPAYQYVNVVINGDYRGIYMLTETIRRNADCRLNVDKYMGYIIERDAYWWNEPLYFSTAQNTKYTFKYPDDEDVTQKKIDYIQTYMTTLEQAIDCGTYDQLIDLRSFAAWMLAHDLLGTGDAAGSNIYLSKYDDASLLQMTTLWDFGSIMRQDMRHSWAAIHNDPFFYFPRLFNSSNQAFTTKYKELWDELSPYICDSIITFLNDFRSSPTAIALQASRPYEYARWNYPGDTVDENIDAAIAWFTDRHQWLASAIHTDHIIPHTTTQHPSAVIYTLDGQKLPSSQPLNKGIYIINGVKTVIR